MNPADELASSLSGEQIAQVLRSSGPVVSCVILRSKSNAPDAKIGHGENNQESHDSKQDVEKKVLEELIEEIQIDTTPKKQMVSQIVGGPFTFLGQYEEEGIVVIVRKVDHLKRGHDDDDDGDDVSDEEEEAEQDGNIGSVEGGHDDLPLNPHILQPPLHKVQVRGDILLMRVAAVEEENDVDAASSPQETKEEIIDGTVSVDNSDTKPQQQQQQHQLQEANVSEDPADAKKAVETAKFLSNEDFFLDYTKEEYIKFASRTDIVPQNSDDENDGESEESEDEDYEEDEEEKEDDGDYNVESDEEDGFDDEECQVGMMNLILAQLLRKFREENGRGPNTSELLTMRSALAAKLGIDERLVNEEYHYTEDDSFTDKRKLESDQGSEQREKKVKFTNQDEVKIMTDDEALEPSCGANNQIEDAV